jgi:ABC-type multidrug transport system permease subunit
MEKLFSLFDIVEITATISMTMLAALVAYGLWLCFSVDSRTLKRTNTFYTAPGQTLLYIMATRSLIIALLVTGFLGYSFTFGLTDPDSFLKKIPDWLSIPMLLARGFSLRARCMVGPERISRTETCSAGIPQLLHIRFGNLCHRLCDGVWER